MIEFDRIVQQIDENNRQMFPVPANIDVGNFRVDVQAEFTGFSVHAARQLLQKRLKADNLLMVLKLVQIQGGQPEYGVHHLLKPAVSFTRLVLA